MNNEEFRKQGHKMIDWIADYFSEIEKYPVKSNVASREIYNQLPDRAPDQGESIEVIMEDFEKIIMPGITHWQSPGFHAYFPANVSYPSILGETLSTALGLQCMKWVTSPSATELEEKVMEWIRDMIGLPHDFIGVTQDAASTATLCSIISAREKASDFEINATGFSNIHNFKVYCSTETHSSIEKAVKIAGIGKENLVKIAVDEQFRLRSDLLGHAIEEDLADGKIPICVVAAIGTTGSTAIDPLREIGKICAKNKIWLHVDAAYAGTAMILPDLRWMIEGIEYADSFVFNPHKWLFTNNDCSVYFIKDKQLLLRTFEIFPEYLTSDSDEDEKVNDYCHWGTGLGRRFRALKLWFVLRNFGVQGLQDKVQEHISFGNYFAEQIESDPNFEILAPYPVALVCFRFVPDRSMDLNTLNQLNENLLNNINNTGQVFMTHTKLDEKYTLRFACSHTFVKKEHIVNTWKLVKSESEKMKPEKTAER
jgi:aromatic-L-amino-acid/L-tryptophan decarboxylase